MLKTQFKMTQFFLIVLFLSNLEMKKFVFVYFDRQEKKTER